jgi:hypothetical protein
VDKGFCCFQEKGSGVMVSPITETFADERDLLKTHDLDEGLPAWRKKYWACDFAWEWCAKEGVVIHL